MLDFSDFESNCFKLNIARYHAASTVEVESIIHFLTKHNIDLLRLKCLSQESQNFLNAFLLDSYQVFYSHSILNFSIDYKAAGLEPVKNQNLTFEEVSSSSKEAFYDAVFKGMYDEPIGYFKTPLVHSKITKDQESACNAAYYAENYSGQVFDKKAWLVKWNRQYVGAFVFEISSNAIHTSLAAVLPEFRSMGLFNDMRVFQKNYCIQNGVLTASCGARISNIFTTNHLMGQGWKLSHTESVFHIVKKDSFF